MGLLWLKNEVKRIPNLVFLWKNPETHTTVGAQYKFYLQGPDGIVGKKVFVKGSDRTHSLWMTNMMGKSKLFITEDVFDAVAHKLLVRNNSYGYCVLLADLLRQSKSVLSEI